MAAVQRSKLWTARSAFHAGACSAAADSACGTHISGATDLHAVVEDHHADVATGAVAVLPSRATVDVYAWCMGRTNIDIDDELVLTVMRRHGLRTKREAVDLALRRLAGPPLTAEFLSGLRGIGWVGDLDDLRAGGDQA